MENIQLALAQGQKMGGDRFKKTISMDMEAGPI